MRISAKPVLRNKLTFVFHPKNNKMKAIRIHEFGGPEVLKLEDIDRPVPAVDEPCKSFCQQHQTR